MQGRAAQASLVGGDIPTSTKSLGQAVAASGSTPVPVNLYSKKASGQVAMAADSVSTTGGSQPHTNMMPSLVLNYVIALQGIFPSQN